MLTHLSDRSGQDNMALAILALLWLLLRAPLAGAAGEEYQCTVGADGTLTTFSREVVDISVPCWYELVSIMVDLDVPSHDVWGFLVEIHGLNILTDNGTYSVDQLRLEISFIRTRPRLSSRPPLRRNFVISARDIRNVSSSGGQSPWRYGSSVTVYGLTFNFDWDAKSKIAIFTSPRGGPVVTFRAGDGSQDREPVLIITAERNAGFYQAGPIPLCMASSFDRKFLNDLTRAFSFESPSLLIMGIIVTARSVAQTRNPLREECLQARTLANQCKNSQFYAINMCGCTLNRKDVLATLAEKKVNIMGLFVTCLRCLCNKEYDQCLDYVDVRFANVTNSRIGT